MKSKTEQFFSFGEFELNGAKRLLLKQGEPVSLNAKAFDLLFVLVVNHGQIIHKDELLEKVWENQFVEENNLTVHISALRKIFGEKKNEHKFIVTIPGRGYSFVADVEEERKKGRARSEDQNSSPLIGRTREISEIENLLRGDEFRLLTLTGAGGSGKTSLARTVADNLTEDFSDGVFFSELAAVGDAELVAAEIAKTLGVEESGVKSLSESLTDFLQERRVLLILDNFEQILSAAPLLQKLLNSTAFLKILVTSRRALCLRGEREIIVVPLALPPMENDLSAEKLNEYAAVELFTRQAKFVRQNFLLNDENAKAVTEICRRLDGLPLAIELAAARVKLLSPQSILERLENSLNLLSGGAKDLPERQRTMRGAISWSYELLDENEQKLFRRLAIFAGGFTVEAAETVCENDESEVQTLDLLSSLVDNNLLNIKDQPGGDSRLQMLEVMREFAFEMLRNADETGDLRIIHAGYFLDLAETAEEFIAGETGGKWLEKLETEHDNLRHALTWSLENDAETAVRMAAALRYFWLNHSHLGEGLSWSKAALKVSENSISEARLKLLMANGLFLRNAGDLEAARKIYESGLAESEKIKNLPHVVKANHGLGAIAALQKDFAAAQKFIEEALAISREINDETKTAYSLCSLGDLEMSKQNPSAARPLLEECLSLSQKLGNNRLLTTTRFNLGTIDCLEKRYETAAANFAESLRIAEEMGNKTMISCSLDGFAAIAAAQGNAEQSATLAGAAENLRESIGYKNEPAEEIFINDYLTKVRRSLDEKSFVTAFLQGRRLNLSEAVALADNSFFDGQINEIIIETHKFERIIIEEETDESDYEIKQINFLSQNNE